MAEKLNITTASAQSIKKSISRGTILAQPNTFTRAALGTLRTYSMSDLVKSPYQWGQCQ